MVAVVAGGCRGSTTAEPGGGGEYEPPTPTLRSRYAVDFSARNQGCRGIPLGGYDGQATLALADGEATLDLEMRAEDVFAGVAMTLSPETERRASEPVRCRWRGRGRRTPASFEGILELAGDDAACGQTRRLSLACAPWSTMIADADRDGGGEGTRAPVDVIRCELRGAYPEALWVLESGGVIILGATPLRSEIELHGLGGSTQRLSRGADVGSSAAE
ncbi:MAG: hypothetical protein KC486_20790 [Myxococcales bacterium]|nr:hypothetical protein [Myxococcales bacterium]